MSLSDVKYQGRAQDMLQRAYARDRIPHAYIFHGPDGVGKETLARGFAQLLLCGSPIDHTLAPDAVDHVGVETLRTGCGKCEDCHLATADTHPDMHLVYRQLIRQHPDAEVRKRKGLDIGVDVIRHFVINGVHLTPARGRAKVFIIREADRITTQAQNALLKTLEEPPGTTYLILLTASIDRLLPTTLSRCQLVEFGALPTDFIRARVQRDHSDLSPAQLDWYARVACGSIGDAYAAIENDLFALGQTVASTLAKLDERTAAITIKTWTEAAESIAGAFSKRDPDITDTEAKRTGFKTIFRLAADCYAEALRIVSGETGDGDSATKDEQAALLAGRSDAEALIERINRIAQSERQLDRNVHVQLCVETLVNELAAVPARA